MEYLIKTERLGLRNWNEELITQMIEVSADPEVMKYFPATATPEQTITFFNKMKKLCEDKSYCYFAAEILETKEFIGFIGLCYQEYKAEFTPCTDIGWRLKTSAWNMGYATEGARACMDYAFKELNLEKVYAVASANNLSSINVMKKIGMEYQYNFDHPKLLNFPKIKDCVLYASKAK